MDCRRRWAVDDDRSRRWVVDDDRYPRRWAVDGDRSRIAFYQAQVKVSLDQIDKNLDRINKNLRSIRRMRMSSATIPRYSSSSSSFPDEPNSDSVRRLRAPATIPASSFSLLSSDSHERHRLCNKTAVTDDYPPLDLPLRWRDPPPDRIGHNHLKYHIHTPLERTTLLPPPDSSTLPTLQREFSSASSRDLTHTHDSSDPPHDFSPFCSAIITPPDHNPLLLCSCDSKPTPVSVRTALPLPCPLSLISRDTMANSALEVTEKPVYKIDDQKNHASLNPPPQYSSPSSESLEGHRSQNIHCSSITKHIEGYAHEVANKVDEYAITMIRMSGSSLFEELGLYYIGLVNDHNIDDLLIIFQKMKSIPAFGPVLEEGKGCLLAEAAADKIHGADAKVRKQAKPWQITVSCIQYFAESLITEANETLLAKRKLGSGTDLISWDAIIGALLRTGENQDAQKLFDEMPCRDMINGMNLPTDNLSYAEENYPLVCCCRTWDPIFQFEALVDDLFGEFLLIYDIVPNNSLERLLFDKPESILHLIKGIAFRSARNDYGASSSKSCQFDL